MLSQEKRELRSGYHRFSANENRTYSTSGRMHETSVVFEQNQFYLKVCYMNAKKIVSTNKGWDLVYE